MTKILNLDKLETKREKVIILNGKEHVMKTFTVKEYIYHMRKAESLAKLEMGELETLTASVEIMVDVLTAAFPTVKRKEFEELSMAHLQAIHDLVEDTTQDDLSDGDSEGEAQGEKVAE